MIRLAATLLTLSLLAGCGIKGGLERPAPMWGDERAAAEAEAERTGRLPPRNQSGPLAADPPSSSEDELGAPR